MLGSGEGSAHRVYLNQQSGLESEPEGLLRETLGSLLINFETYTSPLVARGGLAWWHAIGFRRLKAEYPINVAVVTPSALLDKDFLVQPFVEGAPKPLINSLVLQSERSWSRTLVCH